MADNLHATAVVLGDRGIVIAGEPGMGKTQLALDLISHARSQALFARLVADDQIFLAAHRRRLLCAAPPAITMPRSPSTTAVAWKLSAKG